MLPSLEIFEPSCSKCTLVLFAPCDMPPSVAALMLWLRSYELWKSGAFVNYPPDTLVDVVARILALVPPWTRVYR
jgi:hypothetical protein